MADTETPEAEAPDEHRHGVADPHTQADRRAQTGGASSMFSGGKTAEEKKTRKWSIAGAVVGFLGLFLIVYFYERSKSNAAAATAANTAAGTTYPAGGAGFVAGSSGTSGGGGFGGGGGYGAGIAAELGQLSTQLGSLQTQVSASAARPGVPGPRGPAGPSAGQVQAKGTFNPYPIGTKVTSSESIVQAIYDPTFNAYVDLTSQGGLYTGPGAVVAGSAYNPRLQGQPLREQLGAGGKSVNVYSGSKLLGSYSLKA